MFGFITSLFSSPEQKAMLDAKRQIEKAGGAASFLNLLSLVLNMRGLKKDILSGSLKFEEQVEDRFVVGVASIQLLMDAKRRLRLNALDQDAKSDCELAEEMFVISHMMKASADEKWVEQQDAENALLAGLQDADAIRRLPAELKRLTDMAAAKRLNDAAIALKRWQDYDVAKFKFFISIR